LPQIPNFATLVRD